MKPDSPQLPASGFFPSSRGFFRSAGIIPLFLVLVTYLSGGLDERFWPLFALGLAVMAYLFVRELDGNPDLPVFSRVFLPFLILVGFAIFQGLPLPHFLSEWLLTARRHFLLLRIPDYFPAFKSPGEINSISFIPGVTRTVGMFFVIGLGISFFTFNGIKDLRDCRRFATVLVSGMFALVFISFVDMGLKSGWLFFTYPAEFVHRDFGPIPNYEHFAGVLALVFPFAVYLAVTEEKKEFKALFSFFAVVILSALITTTSRAAMVGIFLSGLLIMVIGKWYFKLRIRTWHFLLPVGFLLASFLFVNLAHFFQDVKSLFTPWDEMSMKLKLWQDAMPVFQAFPFIGDGLGTFPSVYPVFRGLTGDFSVFSPESIYVLLIVETGLIGVALTAWVFASFLRRTLKRLKSRHHREVWAFVLAGLTGIFSILIYSVAEFGLEVPAVALGLAAVLGATYRATLVTEDSQGSEPVPETRKRRGGAILAGGAVFLAGILPLSQGLLAQSYKQHWENRCVPSPARDQAGPCSEPDRLDRVFRGLDRIGPGDVSPAAGEFFFNLSRKSGPGGFSEPFRVRTATLARGHFRACLRRDAFNNVCRTRLAWVLWQEKNLADAERLLQAVRGINPHDPNGLYNLGNFYYYTGKFTQAREMLTRVRGKMGRSGNAEIEEKSRILDLLLKLEDR
ncbi:MAG: O-antigen ligase family protein [bacterium]|nr:O-antigen ligase family protein [bacterium]